MALLVGTWKFVESHNLGALFGELGAHEDVCKNVSSYRPSITIHIQENEVTLIYLAYGKTTQQTFILGKETEELTLDGRIVHSTIIIESDRKIVHIQKHGFTETVITREVNDDILMVTLKTGDLVATIKYVRIKSGE